MLPRFHLASAAVLACLSGLLPAGAAEPPRVSTDGSRILVNGSPVFLKGVDYSPYTAGDAPWIGIRKVDVRKDVLDIKNRLNANAVRVYEVMPRAFYDAAREAGIWVIQGIHLPAAQDLVEVLPGYKEAVEFGLNRVYEAQAADVIIAYALGSGFPPDTVSTTIARHGDLPRYAGKHYQAPASPNLPAVDFYPGCGKPAQQQFPDPLPFQSVMAELADFLAEQEDVPGRMRHLVGHPTTPFTSPFLGTRDRVTPNPVDMSFLDVVFENVFTYNAHYVAYQGFDAYLRELKSFYDSTPVVLLETGYSTSPNSGLPPPPALCGFPFTTPQPFTYKYGGVSEDDQALAMEQRWVEAVCAPRPLAGFFAYEYYDEWWPGGNIERQDADQPLEYFGLVAVGGSAANPSFREKPAFRKLSELYGCEESGADPARCGIVQRSPRLLTGTYGVHLDLSLEAAGGAPPYRFSVASGSLPSGVQLDAASGKLQGTPERMGAFQFRLRVEDSSGSPQVRERLTCFSVGPPAFSIDRDAEVVLQNGEPFFLKGIDYSPFIAGDAPWSGMNKADPFADLREIKEDLHANAIRVYQSVSRKVYDAARENGLFVIQGIHLQLDCRCPCACTEDCAQGDCDFLDPSLFQKLKDHVAAEIDEVNKAGASDVVLCYVVGNEVDFCAVRTTIKKHQDRSRYQGRFYSAPPQPSPLPAPGQADGCPAPPAFLDAHPFQSFIAELVDSAAIRENDRHGVRHLMAHATEPNTGLVPGAEDRYEPACHFPADMSFLDILFQNVYSYFPPYIRFRGFRRYLEEADAAYQGIPFVVLENGYSTSPEHDSGVGGCATPAVCGQPSEPEPLSFCFGGNTPDEQAQGIAAQWERAVRPPSPVAGFFVFEYFDEWWKGSNRSEFVQDQDRVEEWFGLKSVSGFPSNFQVANKPAFETVGRMFDTSWCPEESRLACRVGGGQVEVTLDAPEAYQSITLTRDGVVIVERNSEAGPGPVVLTDAAPPAGDRRYGVRVRKSFVECEQLECSVTVPGGGEPMLRRADVDGDGKLDITDPILVLGFLFLAGATPTCPDAADGNDDGVLDLSDAVISLGRLFQGGEPIPTPGPETCGQDPTADELGLCQGSGC